MYKCTATRGRDILSPSLPPYPSTLLPSFLSLQGYESDLLSSLLLAEEYAPIPDPQHTSATPTVVAGYQFSCNKTAVYIHTTVGSGGWHMILCVHSHSILLSGNQILCCMQLYKAVCILIHPLLPLSFPHSSSLPCPSLPPSLFLPPSSSLPHLSLSPFFFLLLLLTGESHPSFQTLVFW